MSDHSTKKNTVGFSAKFDAALRAKLEELAAKDRRPLSTYVELVLERHVAQMTEKRAA